MSNYKTYMRFFILSEVNFNKKATIKRNLYEIRDKNLESKQIILDRLNYIDSQINFYPYKRFIRTKKDRLPKAILLDIRYKGEYIKKLNNCLILAANEGTINRYFLYLFVEADLLINYIKNYPWTWNYYVDSKVRNQIYVKIYNTPFFYI